MDTHFFPHGLPFFPHFGEAVVHLGPQSLSLLLRLGEAGVYFGFEFGEAVVHLGPQPFPLLLRLGKAAIHFGFAKLEAEMDSRFAEAKEEQENMRREMRSYFRWTLGLMLPIVLGVISLIIKFLIFGSP